MMIMMKMMATMMGQHEEETSQDERCRVLMIQTN